MFNFYSYIAKKDTAEYFDWSSEKRDLSSSSNGEEDPKQPRGERRNISGPESLTSPVYMLARSLNSKHGRETCWVVWKTSKRSKKNKGFVTRQYYLKYSLHSLLFLAFYIKLFLRIYAYLFIKVYCNNANAINS